MQLTYQLTAQDYRLGLLACRRRTKGQRWRALIGSVIVYSCLAFILVMISIGAGRLSDIIAFLFLAAFWGAVKWYAPHRFGKKMMKDSPLAQAEHTLEVSDTGIESRTALANSSISWKSIVDWVEGKTMFAVFLSSVSFFPLPKRAMTDGQLEELRTLLREKVNPRN
jgi:hypothetical protein